MTYAAWTWIAVGVQLLAVEAIALARGDQLLTDAMRAGSNRWLLWPALFGTLCGHFFGRASAPAWSPWLLAPLGLAILTHDFVLRRSIADSHLEFFLLFVGIGAFLWGSR